MAFYCYPQLTRMHIIVFHYAKILIDHQLYHQQLAALTQFLMHAFTGFMYNWIILEETGYKKLV